MILELAILNVHSGLEPPFERAFGTAAPIIASVPDCLAHPLLMTEGA